MLDVVVYLVVVYRQEVAVVVGVKAVRRVVVHLVPPPVALLVPVRIHAEVVVVDVGVVHIAVYIDGVEHLRVAFVLAEPANLIEV